MKKSTRKNFLLCLALLGLGAVSASAQSDTIAAGYFTVNITAGSSTSPALSVLSFPLQGTATAAGQMVGLVTGVTSNTVTNSGAGWTAGQLSVPATPYLIQFTSGTAAGRTFLISTSTANTSTTLTIDATDASFTNLTTLGIVAGTDTYAIIPADTISSIFGTPATTGILGGTSAVGSDELQLFTGSVWQSYYYNTTQNNWLHVGAPTVSNNIVIRPDTGVIYNRYGTTPISLMLLGQVPSVARQALVNNGGITLLSNSWPVDLGLGKTATETIGGNTVTLNTLNLEKTPGWVTNTSSALADTVIIYAGGVWKSYFNNGTDWIHVGAPTSGDSVIIPAGSSVIVAKLGTASGASVLSEILQYSL